MKIGRTLNQVAAIAKTDFLGVLRNKTAIFFTLLFPLFFIIIIGFTFGQSGTSDMSSIKIGVVNLDCQLVTVNSTGSYNSTIGDLFVEAMETANFTITKYNEYGDINTTGTAAYDLYYDNRINSILIIPANFTESLAFQYIDSMGAPIPTKAQIQLYVDPTETTGALITQQSVLGFVSGFKKYYQEIVIEQTPQDMKAYVKVIADPISVATSDAEGTEELPWIDYMVPGTLGLVLLWSGLNHASMTIATERTKGTFQRMVIAPVSPTTVLLGKFLSNLALVYMSAAIMLASGILLFQVHLHWDIPLMALAIFLGSLSAIGIGLIISSLSKNEEAANSIAVIISVPLQFFIGAFFPLTNMPEAAQAFGNALPFTKLVDAMTAVMTKNLPFDAVIPEITYLAISGVILFLIGTVAYRFALKRL
jgi:ABC-2 type transport system permease protein